MSNNTRLTSRVEAEVAPLKIHKALTASEAAAHAEADGLHGHQTEDEVQLDGLDQFFRQIIVGVGEDPDREGLLKTPTRAASSLKFLTQGYEQSLDEILNNAIFEESTSNMVMLRDIEFFSLCEHHMIPFFGKCHIAYIPNGKIVGVSKMARIVDMFARRLQVQERMTNQIADALENTLKPLGVGVVAEGYHLCMAMRGVQKQHAKMTTSAMRGAFLQMPTRMEMMSLLRGTEFSF